MLKFMYNGIKLDGKLHKAHYSKGSLFNYPEGTITIYARDYEDLPKIEGLSVQNETDLMTDYFDSDKIRVTPDNKYYELVLEAFDKQQAKIRARAEKRRGA